MTGANRDSQSEKREKTGENAGKARENTQKAARHEGIAGDHEEIAGDGTKATAANVPRYTLGYPRIEVETHRLWAAQQAGWPDMLPHDAWGELVKAYNDETKPKASSAEHPAFSAKYAPNYIATPEISEAYKEQRQGGKPRR
jgi:hypothetical protein